MESFYNERPKAKVLRETSAVLLQSHQQFALLHMQLRSGRQAQVSVSSPLLSFLSCLPGARLLEEGNIEAAEEQKQRIEQLQRERRRVLQDNNMTHQPRFFKYALVLHAPVSVPPSACSAYDRASPFTSATVTHVV